MSKSNESLSKLGEQQIIRSTIKEKFKHLKRLANQKQEIELEERTIVSDIEELSRQGEEIADWLLQKEYELLSELESKLTP